MKINRLILVCICLVSLTVGGCGNKEKKDVQIENNELEQSQEPINNGKDYLLVYYKDKQGESLLAKKIAIKKITGDAFISGLMKLGMRPEDIFLSK